MKKALILLALLSIAFIAACGGDDDGGDQSYTADEIVEKVREAIIQPDMVFHARGDDGSEVWLDPTNQRFRRAETAERGGLTTIGEGWVRYSYDPFSNEVQTENLDPGVNRPRIDTPAAPWWEPLTSLAYGVEINVIGLSTADGNPVIVVEVRSPVLDSNGQLSGNVLQGRIELDPETFVPIAFEQREIVGTGNAVSQATPQPRIRYTTEIAPLANVPEGFFSRDLVDGQVQTIEESLQQVHDIGLTPYWLGEEYVGQLGVLKLPEANPFTVDTSTESVAIRYAFIAQVSPTQGEALDDSIIISLAHNLDELIAPNVPEFAGELPEQRQDVTVRGGTGVVLASLLTPSDLPCESGTCPATNARLYFRIQFTIGDVAVQIESFARIDAAGTDRNTFNSVAGLTELAEAMSEAIAPSPTPTATP